MKENIKDLFKKTFGVEPNSICEIAAHGSSRKYFRCQTEVVKVLAAYNGDKKENLAFIDFAKQLKAKGINVPAIIAVDEEKDIYLLEDLGLWITQNSLTTRKLWMKSNSCGIHSGLIVANVVIGNVNDSRTDSPMVMQIS
jgi:aminoglycoside/choline kinase family phosphotransferase